jgi:DNA topoisomerase I
MAAADVSNDPAAAAAQASLRYVSDARPGITRHRSGRGFTYRDSRGARITDTSTLERIASLVIPPAWTDVWICPTANGHVQATGRDARGRKQHRYHPRWREVRDESKYARLAAFARSLPVIRRAVAADLSRPGMPREKVLALLV